MTQHLDPEQLAELKEVLEDEFCLLIDTYITDAQFRLQLITQGVEANDYEAVRLAAHSLKGASANLGAMQLADLCEKLEHDCKIEQYGECADLLGSITTELTQVEIILLNSN